MLGSYNWSPLISHEAVRTLAFSSPITTLIILQLIYHSLGVCFLLAWFIDKTKLSSAKQLSRSFLEELYLQNFPLTKLHVNPIIRESYSSNVTEGKKFISRMKVKVENLKNLDLIY